jgi:hypothetical protein
MLARETSAERDTGVTSLDSLRPLAGPTTLVTRLRRVDVQSALSVSLSLLLLCAFFAVPYLPMVDLPQHAAQISIWQRLADPTLPEHRVFELNLRTPYIGAYVLARVLATWLGAVPALKLVAWLAVVGHFAAFSLLVRTLGHPRWLGLLGLPFGLGYGFYFGFVSFIAAVPFGLLAMSAALVHRQRPSVKTGLLLAAALCATLATHGFAFGMTVAIVCPLLCRGAGTLVTRFAPLLAPAILCAIWLVPGSSAHSIGLTIWDPRVWELSQVPALLLASSGADYAASAFGVLLLGLVVSSLGRPSHALERALPLSFMVLGYCLFPLSLGGFGPLHPRFAVFMVPALLIACEPRVAARSSRIATYIALASVAWLGLFVQRLSLFARETRPVFDFVSRMPSGLSIRPIVFERTSSAFPALPALLHLSAYYVPEKAGRQGYSFAMYPTSVIRYVSTVTPTMDGGAEWHPETFSASAELDQYDCFLVHSTTDRASELFGTRERELSLVFHEASWWAYLTRSALEAQRVGSRKGMGHEQPLVVSR